MLYDLLKELLFHQFSIDCKLYSSAVLAQRCLQIHTFPPAGWTSIFLLFMSKRSLLERLNHCSHTREDRACYPRKHFQAFDDI